MLISWFFYLWTFHTWDISQTSDTELAHNERTIDKTAQQAVHQQLHNFKIASTALVNQLSERKQYIHTIYTRTDSTCDYEDPEVKMLQEPITRSVHLPY